MSSLGSTDGGGVFVADEIGGAAEVVVDDPAEDHRDSLRASGRPARDQAITPPFTLTAS